MMTADDDKAARDAQTLQVSSHLERGGVITQLDALKWYGIGRLSARIYDLRKSGLDVRTRMVVVVKSNGQTARVAEYYLGPGS